MKERVKRVEFIEPFWWPGCAIPPGKDGRVWKEQELGKKRDGGGV